MKTRTTALTAIGFAALLVLTGCAGATPVATDQPPASEPQADSLAIENSWVKSADDGMSAAFGTLENDGTTDITVVSVTSEASDTVELHETVENDAGAMVMQPKEGGFVIPAGKSFELAPGANHIMLMGLTAPIKAGDDVTFTLTLGDGSDYTFTAPGKDYSGANETYQGGEMDMDK